MNKRKILSHLGIFCLAALVSFLTTKLLISLFPEQHSIAYSDTLTSAERTFLEDALKDVEVKEDTFITIADAASRPQLAYDILVPVTSWNSPESDLESAQATSDDFISISNLSPDKKLLSLDGAYFFDDYKGGAKYREVIIEGDQSIADKIAEHLPAFPNSSNTLSLTQTGVTALSRLLNTKLATTDSATYFTENLQDLKSSDYLHISNEVSFADNCVSTRSSTVLCSDPAMLTAITDLGVDIIELTGNHNNDYGADANVATINAYHDQGIKTFGGGKTAEDAATPLKLSDKSANITLLGYNYSTTSAGNGGAIDDVAGANLYDEAKAAADIKSAKDNGDFVIVDVQFFECYSYPDYGEEYPFCDAPITGTYSGQYYDQAAFFRHLIDLGADMVIGTSAHQPQTFELYQGKPIYYGLGNLFFDQTYWPGTTRSLVLTHYFVNGKYLQTRIRPTVYDESYQTRFMTPEESTTFLTRLINAGAE